MNTFKSPFDERDYKFKNIFNIPFQLPNLTDDIYLDLRHKLLEVRNQKSSHMCTAFASCTIKEYQEIRECNLHDYFSPSFIYDRRSTPIGMHLRDALNILRIFGCCREFFFPFEGTIQDGAMVDASNYKIDHYCRCESVDDIKKALRNVGPVIISLPCYSRDMDFWVNKNGKDLDTGHTVLIVGYIENSFIFRNSWGKTWGSDGHGYLPFSEFKTIWDAFCVYDSTNPHLSKPTNYVLPKEKDNKCKNCIIC